MSVKYKDGKLFEPKPKAQKRKRVEESVNEHTIALLLHKRNLIQQNIADDFLNPEIREMMVLERIKKLENLSKNELLKRLAKTELHLEATLFLYDETFKQKKFLEDKYQKSGEKRLIQAANKTAGKAKVHGKYIHVKEVAREILDGMDQKDFKTFCRKMRAKFPMSEISNSAIRNYFKEITGLKSTK
jgi:hypothetical protein